MLTWKILKTGILEVFWDSWIPQLVGWEGSRMLSEKMKKQDPSCKVETGIDRNMSAYHDSVTNACPTRLQGPWPQLPRAGCIFSPDACPGLLPLWGTWERQEQRAGGKVYRTSTRKSQHMERRVIRHGWKKLKVGKQCLCGRSSTQLRLNLFLPRSRKGSSLQSKTSSFPRVK